MMFKCINIAWGFCVGKSQKCCKYHITRVGQVEPLHEDKNQRYLRCFQETSSTAMDECTFQKKGKKLTGGSGGRVTIYIYICFLVIYFFFVCICLFSGISRVSHSLIPY